MECTAKPEDMDVQTCSICLDPMTAETGEVKLACAHTFHLRCIGRWATRGDTNCPMCRKEMVKEEIIDGDDDVTSSVSFSEREELDDVGFVARFLGMSRGRAQIYVDTFNGNTRAVMEYVRYIRHNHDDPFYIPPLERINEPPVIPDFDQSSDEFLRKRHWMHYSEKNYYLVDRGYLTE